MQDIDWETFSTEPGDYFTKDQLNIAFSSAFMSCVNAGFKREATRKFMLNYMKAYADYGATDTVCKDVLETVLDRHYDKE